MRGADPNGSEDSDLIVHDGITQKMGEVSAHALRCGLGEFCGNLDSEASCSQYFHQDIALLVIDISEMNEYNDYVWGFLPLIVQVFNL